ncbi:MAG: nucleotidyltransferase domain-containing protein [Methanobacteriota archaeon]
MTECDKVLSIPKREVMSVKDRFGVRRMGFFGSVIRGGAGDQSDIDIFIELDPVLVSYRKYLDLEEHLQSLFPRKVRLLRPTGFPNIFFRTYPVRWCGFEH